MRTMVTIEQACRIAQSAGQRRSGKLRIIRVHIPRMGFRSIGREGNLQVVLGHWWPLCGKAVEGGLYTTGLKAIEGVSL